MIARQPVKWVEQSNVEWMDARLICRFASTKEDLSSQISFNTTKFKWIQGEQSTKTKASPRKKKQQRQNGSKAKVDVTRRTLRSAYLHHLFMGNQNFLKYHFFPSPFRALRAGTFLKLSYFFTNLGLRLWSILDRKTRSY